MSEADDRLKPLLIRASAGTGKTYQLTGRLLRILLRGASPDSILATTFTRKAAGEILNRLLFTLADAATNESSLASLRSQIEEPNLPAERPAPLLHWILKEIHRLRVCTLDSLFSQLARSFSFELRLPPGWQLTDEIEETWFSQQAIGRMLEQFESREVESLFHMLNKGQAERSVELRLLQVVHNNYAGFRRSRREAWTTLDLPLAPEAKEITWAIGVLENAEVGHKSANAQLKKLADEALAGEWDQVIGATPVLGVSRARRAGEPLLYYKRELQDDIADALQVLFDRGRHEFVKRLKMQTEATGDILEAYDRNLHAIKQQARRFSFDDVSHQLAHWIDSTDADQSKQSVERLAARMDASLDHVLLDEFQDTAPVQWDVLRPFAARTAVDTESPERTFFCVGDTKQAIYGWRGGDARIFDAVKQELPELHEQPQDISFRSSPVIMDAVNRVFNNLDKHPSFSDRPATPLTSDEWKCHALHEFQSSFRQHDAHFSDRAGYFQFATGPLTDGNKADRVTSHLKYVAQQVKEIADVSKNHSIGVLTRTNYTVGHLIYMLRQKGLDVSQEGGNPLIDSAAVELVLSAIRLSEHPGDLRWRFHLANSPLGEALGLSAVHNRNDAMAESHRVSAELRDRIEHNGLVQTIRELADALLPHCGSSDRLRLRQLLGIAHQYLRSPQPRLSAFVELVMNRRVERPREAQIRVMTIHQAKGLEFDAVVLPELDGGLSVPPQKCVTIAPTITSLATGALRYVNHKSWELLPSEWQIAFGRSISAAMTESLCTLYVALTRPVHALYSFVQPPTKGEFKAKTAAALVYHALGASEAIEPESTLLSFGNPDWSQASEREESEPAQPVANTEEDAEQMVGGWVTQGNDELSVRADPPHKVGSKSKSRKKKQSTSGLHQLELFAH